MKGLLRGFGRREPGETLELSIEDDRYVYLDHLCAGSEQHRLLGVELSEEERASLRVGAPVGLVLSCDACLWERRVVFRLRYYSRILQ
jgi:hypothetical protein